MEFSEGFLNLVQQQLKSFEDETSLQKLVLYVAQTRDGTNPSLEVVGQWPSLGNALPPVEADPELRSPSPRRRWYPLQEGSILLGVLRAERVRGEQIWPEALDNRLKASAMAFAQCLCLELDRRKLLDQLHQQREQIGLMVHQLRNPLAALRTYAQLLLRKLGPESNHRPLVEGLLSEQAQLNRYLSALDELSQAKLSPKANGPAPLLLPPVLSNESSINIRSLLEPLIDRSAATANLQGRKWVGPSKWPSWTNQSMDANDGLIAEIVANLLENAFRYSSSDSEVGLHLMESGVCVWDGGSPIDLEEREKIFKKGFRGKSTGVVPGSGLGLALGRELAEQLGGNLQLLSAPSKLDSILPKRGNAFVLTLPIKALQEDKD